MKNKLTIIALSVIHLVVDLVSISVIFSTVSSETVVILTVLYNFLAFAMQAPLGALLDKVAIPKYFAMLGYVFLIVAVLLTGSPVAAIIFVGLGNALFHIAGGYITLSLSKKIGWLGLFVAPGALGLFLGRMLPFSPLILIGLVVICLVITLLMPIKIIKTKVQKMPSSNNATLYVLITVKIILLVVCFRSYIGFAASLAPLSLPILLTLGVVIGKVLGGVIADKIGVYKTAFSSLVVSAVLFLFAGQSGVVSILTVLFFNMTMPLTLFSLYKFLGEQHKGLAFGLTTLALFLGFLLSLVSRSLPFYIISILTLCSLGLFWLFKLLAAQKRG